MGEYIPSAKVRLLIRFDEFESNSLENITPKVPSTLAKGVRDTRAKLVAEEYTENEITRWRVTSSQTGSGQSQDSSQDALTHVLAGIIPKQAQISINGVPNASTASVTIRYVDMPIDPRTIRSCAIDIYVGTVSAEDFAKGIAGATRSVSSSAAGVAGNSTSVEPLHLIPDTWIDSNNQPRTNLRFEGYVDKFEIEAGDDSESVVRLDCRDNTCLMIDQTCPPKLTISSKLPIDKAIAEYLANFPLCEGLSVEYRPSGADIPVLDTVLAKTAFRPKLGPSPTGGSTEKMSVWDYITDVTSSIGHSLRVQGSVIVIQRIRNLYGSDYDSGGGRFDDPYQVRIVDGMRLLVRRFIYGRNIKSLKINRTFKSTPTNVELRCYSEKDKTTIVERYPVKSSKTQKHAAPGDKADQKWIVRRVYGITDKKTLRVIAQSYYEAQGRDELGITISTSDLASFGGDNLDPDILDMQVGDPFRVIIDAKSTANYSSVCSLEALMLNTRKAEQFLAVAKGFSAAFAKAYVDAYNNRNMVSDFICRTLQINWDAAEGVGLDIQGVNYIVIRMPELPETEQQKGNKN